MEREADVVVIGGGIVGCSAALHLARRGQRVVLVEKGDLAWEQSTRNWGWVRQNGRNLAEIPLMIEAIQAWSSLRDEIGRDVGWVQGGSLNFAYTQEQMGLYEAWHHRAAAAGLHTRLLSSGEATEFAPGLEGDWVGAIFSPNDGQADPHRTMAALADAAREAGVSVHERCAVERIEVAGGAVVGVQTERGEVRAPAVILAAGAWSSRLAWPLGVRIPQRAIRSTVLATTPAEPLTSMLVWGNQVTFRQGRDGRFIVAGGGSDQDVNLDTIRNLPKFLPSMLANRGYTRLHVGKPLLRDLQTLLPGSEAHEHPFGHLREHEPPPNHEAAWGMFERFRALAPRIEHIGVERIWAGNIDYTPDRVPVISEAGEPRGLVIATGFSGHGFALGPIAGRLAAQLAAGEAPAVDLHPYRLARFAEGDTHEKELHY